jgi:hypothetical protein
MVDLLYIVVIIAFFGLMVAFVRLCEHIIGKDDAVDMAYEGIDESSPVADTHGTGTPGSTTHEEMKV